MRGHLRRERLSDDTGVSLVEVLIGVFVLSVGLFALLSTFIASSRSLMDEEGRAGATRAATQEIERLRAAGEVDLLDQVGEDPSTLEVEVAGRTYEITRHLSWMDATDPEEGDDEDLIYVGLDIRWTAAGSDRSVTFETAIDPAHVDDLSGAVVWRWVA
ncbi:hypothetical protein ER308_19300 [Egibacter rhizosphaerae]|uniref:Type II secretion system protein n=1 Tax=Egibacter rhizosphaerae TaxID=1670831 RepID=A0A411YJX4_9ACTN|nr:hypothetical protein [Egibacter rhizosphaerae]QBI21504.1 hypothetical protein ER308_19300 [Egibacter rhizosphaerae]